MWSRPWHPHVWRCIGKPPRCVNRSTIRYWYWVWRASLLAGGRGAAPADGARDSGPRGWALLPTARTGQSRSPERARQIPEAPAPAVGRLRRSQAEHVSVDGFRHGTKIYSNPDPYQYHVVPYARIRGAATNRCPRWTAPGAGCRSCPHGQVLDHDDRCGLRQFRGGCPVQEVRAWAADEGTPPTRLARSLRVACGCSAVAGGAGGAGGMGAWTEA